MVKRIGKIDLVQSKFFLGCPVSNHLDKLVWSSKSIWIQFIFCPEMLRSFLKGPFLNWWKFSKFFDIAWLYYWSVIFQNRARWGLAEWIERPLLMLEVRGSNSGHSASKITTSLPRSLKAPRVAGLTLDLWIEGKGAGSSRKNPKIGCWLLVAVACRGDLKKQRRVPSQCFYPNIMGTYGRLRSRLA